MIAKYDEAVKNNDLNSYKNYLIGKAGDAKNAAKKGEILGQYYYTTDKAGLENNLSRVDGLEEALNNQLSYNESVAGASFKKTNAAAVDKKYYNEAGGVETLKIETILQTDGEIKTLGVGHDDRDRKLKLETTISSLTNGEIGATIPSYITQITSYSNAAGIVNMGSATPGNLAYIHCADKGISLDSYVEKNSNGDIINVSNTELAGYIQMNEYDEFWGETIIISKPTGLDKTTILIITAIAISSAAVIGAGIILIKKRVLKK